MKSWFKGEIKMSLKKKKKKYVKLICSRCGGNGWYWGTEWAHSNYSPTMKGTDKISCGRCNGTGIYKAEITEE